MDLLLEYVGRVHPLLIHLPITLLILGGVIEVVRVWRETEFLRHSAIWLVGMGALGALVAAGSGWLLAAHGHQRADERVLLEWHRWLGVTTAALGLMSWLSELMWATAAAGPRAILRRLLVWASALGVTATAHWGALLVWGTDWFSAN